MARIETTTISMREIDRLKMIQAVVDGNLKPMVAAVRLSLTARQSGGGRGTKGHSPGTELHCPPCCIHGTGL
jgi:hypothetical protein